MVTWRGIAAGCLVALGVCMATLPSRAADDTCATLNTVLLDSPNAFKSTGMLPEAKDEMDLPESGPLSASLPGADFCRLQGMFDVVSYYCETAADTEDAARAARDAYGAHVTGCFPDAKADKGGKDWYGQRIKYTVVPHGGVAQDITIGADKASNGSFNAYLIVSESGK